MYVIDDYKNLKHLGGGKDGKVFLAEVDDKKFILKQLTEYSKYFLFMTKAYIDAGISSPNFYRIKMVNKNYWVYPYEPLKEIHKFDIKLMSQICDMEIALISGNLLMWDFGINHFNYMINEQGVVKWIDYGGNNFLFIKRPGIKLKRPGIHRNLIIAKNEFVQLQLFYHIGLHGFNKQQYAEGSITIKGTKEHLEDIKARVLSEIDNKELLSLAHKIFKENLLSADGWRGLQREFSR